MTWPKGQVIHRIHLDLYHAAPVQPRRQGERAIQPDQGCDGLDRADELILPVGISIGAAVAAYLARHRPVAGLILVTAFNSLEAVARDFYWWAPVGLLFRNRMPTIEFVRGSKVPTAMIIAERDRIVAKPHSDALSAEIENLVFERGIDAGHNDLCDHPDFPNAAREALMRVEVGIG